MPSAGSTPAAPVAAPPPKISLPMRSNEDALKLFQNSLQAAVLEILRKAGVKWTSLSMEHRGTDAKRPDLCPPTILISSLNANPLLQPSWKAVESSIRAEINRRTKINIQVEII